MSPDGASVDAALEVLKWLPAEQAPSSLASLCALCPGLTEELLAAADPPLVVDHDPGAGGGGWPPPGRPFLRCDFSRDADSWRSPWTGAYFPPLADGAQPSPALRVRPPRRRPGPRTRLPAPPIQPKGRPFLTFE